MPSLRQTLFTLLTTTTVTSALNFDCNHIRVDKQSFDLSKLGGPKEVHRVRWEKPSIENTTFEIDICNPLEKSKKPENDCPTGTRVCGREYDYPSGSKGKGFVKKVIPIAGEYKFSDGKGMEPKFTRLKGSAGNDDEEEGVIVELHGGRYPNEKSGTRQKAIVKFLCDKSVTGNEGFKKGESRMMMEEEEGMEYGRMLERRAKDDDEDDDEPDLPDQDKNKNLKFISYKKEDEVEVLRLQWKTKFACEGAASEPDDDDDDGSSGDASSGWGFFTWFIIILFLLAAAYIIFGSWLNYTRYGARGWDLIPHGDTIRDIPYIVKDWGSAAAERLKGSDSRGGYSAV